MTRMTGPDCAVMCNLINTHTHTQTHVTSIVDPPLAWEDQCEWHIMTRMIGPDCAVMCNLINTHTYTYTHKQYVNAPIVLHKASFGWFFRFPFLLKGGEGYLPSNSSAHRWVWKDTDGPTAAFLTPNHSSTATVGNLLSYA